VSRKKSMKPGEVIRAIERLGGEQIRQKGSHVRTRAGKCFTKAPVHTRDLPEGLLRGSSGTSSRASAKDGGADE